jgi:peptidoglycan/xylan/chitin deacetylase (PgdA/CDA1 family)
LTQARRLSVLLSVVGAGVLLGGILVAVLRAGGSPIEGLLGLRYPIYCGGGAHPYVALTFDDGPTRWTPDLLRVLAQNHARATFFEIGERAARNPDLVKREAAAGEVGEHTWSHRSLPGLSRAGILRELERAKRAIEQLTGKHVDLLRPPFAARNALVDEVSRDLGLLTVLWDADSGDASAASTPPSATIARTLASQARPGAIVLLHEDETVPRTIDALRIFLPELHRRGLRAVTVSDLLRLDPPVRSELPNGSGGCNSSWHQ